MSAINFVVRDVAGNISRGSVAGEGVPASLIVGSGADVSLNLTRGQIISYTRQGQALEITLIDGRVITIEGYFTMEGVVENELFLSADGYLTEVDLSEGAGEDYFANYVQDDGAGKFALNDDLYFMRSADVMLADSFVPADDQVGMLGAALGGLAPMLGWGGAAAAAAGAALIAGSGDGDGSSSSSSSTGPTAPVVDVTTGTVDGNDHVINEEDYNNGVDIGGTGTPGGVVDVTIGDHTETTTVDDDGNWTVEFGPDDLDRGEYTAPVDVVITTDGGSTTVTDAIVVDTEIAVEMEALGGDDGVINAVEYGDGITLTGSVTGGDAVTVTIDGVDYQAEVSETAWSLVVDSTVLGEGEYTQDITITATDLAGNSTTNTGTIVVDTVIGVSTDAVGGDDGVINAAEHAAGITLTGSVTGADAVTVTIDGTDYAAVVTDGTWALDVADGVFGTGEYSRDITVTATDAAGNSSSSTSTLVVDTVIGVDADATGGTDGVINATEYGTGVTLSGTVTGGNSVVVTIDGTDYAATVTGTTWTLDAGTDVITSGDYHSHDIVVTATDAAGNASSATGTVVVDTVTATGISADGVGGSDSVVNSDEHPGGVTLTGTAEAGASVIVTLGTQSHTFTADSTGTWSTTFTASEVPTGEETLVATVVATDAAGNVASDETTVVIDTFVNELEMTSNSAGGADGVVNFDEQSEAITMAGTVEAGSTVSVNLHGVVRAATVDATTGAWTVTYPGGTLPGGEYATTVIVTATDAAGNTSSLTEAVQVDTVAGDLALSSDPIELDDVVNFDEASDGVIINGTATAGLIVTVGFGDATMDVLAQPDGTWSANFPKSQVPADTDAAQITASITDAAGNYKEVSDTVRIDTVVEPFAYSAGQIEGNDIINAAEAQDGGVTFDGQVEANSSVLVEFNGHSQTVQANGAGQWSATFTQAQIGVDEYTSVVKATATDVHDNVSATITRTVEVDTLVTHLTTTDPVEGDNVVNSAEASDGVTLTGTVEAGSTVVITYDYNGGQIVRDAQVDANGNWSLTYSGTEIPQGEYDVDITIAATDANGNTDSITDQFRVDTVASDEPVIEFVGLGDDGVSRIEISGTDDNDYTVSTIDNAGAVSVSASNGDGFDLGSSELFSFDPELSDGTHLVVNETDNSGNQNATYVVLEESRTDVVDFAGLDGFNVGSIDLSFAKDSELTLDLSTLEGLSDNDNNLIIHGGIDDSVTIAGATNSGTSEVVDSKTYEIYTMGDDAKIYIEEDISVTI